MLNGIVGRLLVKVGTRHRSITLRADGRHLLTDVYTSVGVVVGLGLAWLTGWNWMDPVIAIWWACTSWSPATGSSPNPAPD